jgi:hypothetical protein
MNKAFVREPEDDGNAFCPRCGARGTQVWNGPMDTHIQTAFRTAMGDRAWFCPTTHCEVAYFIPEANRVTTDQLNGPIYPKDLDAPVCSCFGLSYEDVEADLNEGTPTRIRELLARSRSPEARCATLAPDGQCCMTAVQELYLRLRNKTRSGP